MANNFTVKDNTGSPVVFASTETGGVHYPAHYAMQYIGQKFAVQDELLQANALTPDSHISLATNNARVVKSSAGMLGTLVAANNHATNWAYLKLYNKASAPTVGTDVPVQVYPLPPGGGLTLNFPKGLGFSLGIAMAITNSITNTNASTGADQVAVSMGYK